MLSSKFVDVETVGFESVKNESAVKLLRMSAPSASLLSLKLESMANDPYILSSPKEKREQNNKFRHAVLYSTENNLAHTLRKSSPKLRATNGKPPKLCFLITCQGSHYAGMGRELYSWSSTFRRHFDACDAIIQQDYGFSVKSIMDSDDSGWVGNPLEALPYILTVQYGLSKLWESWGIKPDIVLGMSFGEYGAAAISGIISLRDAVKLVMTRTKLVTDHIPEEAMGVVEMDVDAFNKALEELRSEAGWEDAWLDVTCVNSPLQTCIVGFKATVRKFVGTLLSSILFINRMSY